MIEGVLPVNGQDDVEGMDLVKFLQEFLRSVSETTSFHPERQRQLFGCHHKADTDLFTVRARVARIPRAAFPLESAWPSK